MYTVRKDWPGDSGVWALGEMRREIETWMREHVGREGRSWGRHYIKSGGHRYERAYEWWIRSHSKSVVWTLRWGG